MEKPDFSESCSILSPLRSRSLRMVSPKAACTGTKQGISKAELRRIYSESQPESDVNVGFFLKRQYKLVQCVEIVHLIERSDFQRTEDGFQLF